MMLPEILQISFAAAATATEADAATEEAAAAAAAQRPCLHSLRLTASPGHLPTLSLSLGLSNPLVHHYGWMDGWMISDHEHSFLLGSSSLSNQSGEAHLLFSTYLCGQKNS
jgi:hypothetical protein